MTVEEAIKQLREQIVPNGSPASVDAIAMAVAVLERLEEKEKEPAPQEAVTSSNNNFSIKNDNTRLKICQEIIEEQLESLFKYFSHQLSGEEQRAFNEGQRYRELLFVKKTLEEEKQ